MVVTFSSQLNFPDSYINHKVFQEITRIMEFYDNLSYSCYLFVPLGINSVPNYASYVYTAIRGTLDSVQTLLKTGRISDAYTLVRKYFDDALIDIYIDVIRKDRFDWGYNRVVKDVDALTAKLDVLLSDAELRQTMGKNSREYAEKYFDIEVVIERHLGIYEELVESKVFSL